jgi:hypothetical protein
MTHDREFGKVVPQKFNYNGQTTTTNAVSLYSVTCIQMESHVSTKRGGGDTTGIAGTVHTTGKI